MFPSHSIMKFYIDSILWFFFIIFPSLSFMVSHSFIHHHDKSMHSSAHAYMKQWGMLLNDGAWLFPFLYSSLPLFSSVTSIRCIEEASQPHDDDFFLFLLSNKSFFFVEEQKENDRWEATRWNNRKEIIVHHKTFEFDFHECFITLHFLFERVMMPLPGFMSDSSFERVYFYDHCMINVKNRIKRKKVLL